MTPLETKRQAAAGALLAAIALLDQTPDHDLQASLMRAHLELKRRELGWTSTTVPVEVRIEAEP